MHGQQNIKKCTGSYECNFYCILIIDMFRPLVWPSLGWWEQEYKHNYSVSKSLHN